MGDGQERGGISGHTDRWEQEKTGTRKKLQAAMCFCHSQGPISDLLARGSLLLRNRGPVTDTATLRDVWVYGREENLTAPSPLQCVGPGRAPDLPELRLPHPENGNIVGVVAGEMARLVNACCISMRAYVQIPISHVKARRDGSHM